MQRPGAADDPLIDDRIAATVLAQVATRGAGRSICPSEVARALAPDWRPLMARVREVARGLAREGRVLITQRGVVRDPEADLRGPVRLAQPPDDARSSGST